MSDTQNQQERINSSRVFSAFCPACRETRGVWVVNKHRECLRCGGTVYDDYDAFVAVGQAIGGKFANDE